MKLKELFAAVEDLKRCHDYSEAADLCIAVARRLELAVEEFKGWCPQTVGPEFICGCMGCKSLRKIMEDGE